MLKDHNFLIDFHWMLPVVAPTCKIDIRLWQSCNPNFRSRMQGTPYCSLPSLGGSASYFTVQIHLLHQDGLSEYEEVECVSFSAENVFVGQCPTRGSLHEGNSMLLHLEGLQYAFIGDMVFSFTAKSTITKFVSLVGNSDVPYPWAMDDLRLLNLVAQYFCRLVCSTTSNQGTRSDKESCCDFDGQGRGISIFIYRECGSGEQAFWCRRYRPLWCVLQYTRPNYGGWVFEGNWHRLSKVKWPRNCGLLGICLGSIFDRFASLWPACKIPTQSVSWCHDSQSRYFKESLVSSLTSRGTFPQIYF